MTTPQDPFAGSTPQDPATQGGYGAPPSGAGLEQPAYGQPQGYGQPPQGYGAPTYGGSSPFGQPGGPQLASWGSRVGAYLIDAAIVLALIIAAFILGALLGTVSDALGGIVIVLGYVAAIGFAFWQLWVQGETGQTIGKKQVGIKLLREQDGQTVGGGLSIGRSFVHIIDSIPCYVGYLWPLWDDKKQTFADKVLKTVVVRT